MKKTCRACYTQLEVQAFRTSPNTIDGYNHICLACEIIARDTRQTYCFVCQKILPIVHFNPARSFSHTCTMCLHNARTNGQNICLHCFTPQSPNHFRLRGTPTCLNCQQALKMRAMKCCRSCQLVKPIDEFAKAMGSLDGHRHTCQRCTKSQPKRNITTITAPQLFKEQAPEEQFVGDLEHYDWPHWAQMLSNAADWMILDLETTGVGNNAEITEIAAITMTGTILINTLVQPEHPIPTTITAKTGITNELVAGKPSFASVYDRYRSLFTFYRILAYNAPFDIRILQNNIRRTGNDEWMPRGYLCLMRLVGNYVTRQEGKSTPMNLGAACRYFDVKPLQAHRALGDCQSSLALLKALAALSGNAISA
jgi:DNA polymerase III subunit epsilon